MLISTVSTPQQERAFLDIPTHIYAGDSNYIRPLDNDIKAVFDPKTNKLLLRGGRCVRWVVSHAQGQVVGRIAAFVNPDNCMCNEQPTGGLGFFECIDNQEVANLLFDTAIAWLSEQGMQAVDGPINFGSRQAFWGLLVQGFAPPSYMVNYNPPYYQRLFEQYGFKPYFNQYSYAMPVAITSVSPLILDKARRVMDNPRYSIRFANAKQLDQLVKDFLTVYNASWGGHAGVRPMLLEEVQSFVRAIKPILDPRLIIFAYYDNQPVGFYIQLPEINKVVRLLHGKFGLVQKLRFMYHMRIKKTCDRVLALVFGVVPEHRGHGLEGAMPIKFAEEATKPGFGYKDIELSWIGDFNPVMMRFIGQLGAKVSKQHTTYRLLFDSDKQAQAFKRCPRIGG